MDPRNFLNEADIFMFETLEYNPAIHTEAAVESALSGSFLAASAGTPDGADTYAAILYNEGKKYNINPVYLANRIIMEQGKVVEQGFVEDLKEKYVMVKGETGDADKAQNYLIYQVTH